MGPGSRFFGSWVLGARPWVLGEVMGLVQGAGCQLLANTGFVSTLAPAWNDTKTA